MGTFVDMTAPLAIGLVGFVIVLILIKVTSRQRDNDETDRDDVSQ